MKKKTIVLLFAISATLLSGCLVQSFYPLYTEKELIRDDRIIGEWYSFLDHDKRDDSLVWKITFKEEIPDKNNKNFFTRKNKPNKFKYDLTVIDYSMLNLDEIPKSLHKDLLDLMTAHFDLHIVKLKEQLYIDIFPDTEFELLNIMQAIHLMGNHSFAKIKIEEQIKVNWINPDWLKELIDKNKVRIRHENNGVYTLLTAKPKELQKFLLKYEDNIEAYEDGFGQVLTRVESSPDEINN
jgi:hypothetical protein